MSALCLRVTGSGSTPNSASAMFSSSGPTGLPTELTKYFLSELRLLAARP